MTETLYQLVHSCWSPNRNFSIRANQLPANSPAAALIALHFPNATLTLSNADEPREDGVYAIINSATCSSNLLAFQTPTITCSFYTDPQGLVQFALSIVGTNLSFSFGSFFPALEEQLKWTELTLTAAEFNLKSIYLSDVACRDLESQYAPNRFPESEEARVVKGWHVSGVPALSQQWTWINTFLGNPPIFRVGGPLEILDGLPRFLFTTPFFAPVAVGHLQPSFAFQMIGWLAQYGRLNGESMNPNFSFRFAANLTPPVGNPPQPVRLFALWGITTPHALSFQLNTQLAVDGALETLDSLFNLPPNAGLRSLLPQGNFPVVSSVRLKTIDFDISLSPFRLERVVAQMGLDENAELTIFPELLKAKKLLLVGELFWNSDAQPQMSLSAKSAVELSVDQHALVLNSRIDLPSLNYQFYLSRNNTFNIARFISHVFPSLGTLPNLYATTLSCSGGITPPKMLFESSFETNAEVDWLALKMSRFGISFYAKRENQTTTLEASAYFVAYIADRLEVNLQGSITREQLNLSGSISTSEKLRLNQILPAGIQLPDYFNTWEFEKGTLEVQRGTTNRVKFSLLGNVNLNFDSVGNIAATSLDVTIEKEEGKDWAIEIETTGAIKLFSLTEQGSRNWLVDLAGKVTINASSLSNWSMVFTADEGSGTVGPIPLPVPKQIVNSNVTLSQVTVHPKSVSITLVNGDWKFDTTSIFKLDTFAFLQNLIPATGTEAHLIIQKINTSYSASLELKNLIGFTIPITIPARQDMPAIALGNTRFELSKASIAISNRLGLTFSAETSWFLPEYINELFGIEGRPEDHNPKFRFFKTYKPTGQVPSDALALKFELGLATNGQPSGNLTLNALPVNLIQPDGDKFVLSFGPATDPSKYGKIKFAKPTLTYNAVKGFEMELDFEIEKDPAIPTRPLIEMLKNAGLTEMANMLPDPLPVPISNPPRFFENGNFNWTLLEDLFKRCGRANLFPQMKTTLEPIARRFEQLPDGLKTYLQPPAIRGLKLKLTASPTGNVEVGFEMKQDPGIKPEDPSEMKRSAQVLLIPGLPLVFFGLRLRKFYFGELFGGQLFSTLIDADVDVFDMPSLIASLVDDPKLKRYIGESRNFKRTIQLHDLRTFIVLVTALPVPIPIPTFYRKVGIDYYGLGDVRFQSSFEFPEPEFDITKLGQILKDLVAFVRDPAKRMPENADYRPMDLNFKMGPLYLETGEWMGKKTIGWKTPLTPPGGISLSTLLAKVLNTIKFFSVNDFIKSIPFENRHAEGALASEFLGMSLGGKFLLSTPYEFVNSEAGRWNLLPEQTTLLMSVLPNGVTKDTPGIVLFLRGEWISTFGSLQTSFGLIAIDSKRFAVGFRFDGTLANSIAINTNAFVTINPPTTPFAFAGTSRAVLKYAGMEFFNGFITATGNHERFDFSGKLQLTEPGQTFKIEGKAEVAGYFNHSTFSISGGGNVSFLIFHGNGSFAITGVSNTQATGKFILNVPNIINIDSTFNLLPTGFTLEETSNLFNIFSTKIIAVLNKSTQTINFTLDAQPLGNLFGFHLSFNAQFGNNLNQKGDFILKIIGLDLVKGKCEYINANTFSIDGTLTLDKLSFSVRGTFSSSGFLLSGSSNFAHIAQIGVDINNQGITFWVEAFGLPRSNTSLKACNDTLYLCSSTGSAKFYIDLKNPLNSRAKDCPCGMALFTPCPYPEKAENFLYVTHLASRLFAPTKKGKPLLTRTHSNEKHLSTVTLVNASRKSFSIDIRRHGHHSDIFTEMENFIADRLGSTYDFLIRRYLNNIRGAYIIVRETTIHEMHKGQVTIEVSFPSAIPHFQRIRTTLSFANPRHAADLIADEMVWYFEEHEWPDQKHLLEKAKKDAAIKVTVLKDGLRKKKKQPLLTEKPITKKLVAKKTVNKKTATKKVTAKKPVAKKAITKKAVAKKTTKGKKSR